MRFGLNDINGRWSERRETGESQNLGGSSKRWRGRDAGEMGDEADLITLSGMVWPSEGVCLTCARDHASPTVLYTPRAFDYRVSLVLHCTYIVLYTVLYTVLRTAQRDRPLLENVPHPRQVWGKITPYRL